MKRRWAGADVSSQEKEDMEILGWSNSQKKAWFHGSVEEVKLRISSIFQGQLSSCWQSWDYMWVAVRLR